jgi:phosphoglycolate phosphatase
VQNLGKVGVHPRALAGSEDEKGDAHLISLCLFCASVLSAFGKGARRQNIKSDFALQQRRETFGRFVPKREKRAGGDMRTVIFDLDGTLADTSGDLIDAANACFRDMGHGDVLRHGEDAAIALRGGRMMLRRGLERVGAFDAAQVDRYYPVLLEAYRGQIARHTVLYPGAMAAVAALAEAGYGVGICTNKPEGLAEQLLAELNIRDAFASMIGADTLPVRKPDPEPLREAARRAGGRPDLTLLVGDSDTDRNTARAAGVPSVLVTFGPAGGDMAALEPEALLDDYAALPAVVAALIGAAS